MAEVFGWRILRPKRQPYVQEVLKEIRVELDKIRRATVDDYKKTTRYWNHDVKFTSMTEITGKGVALLVGTDDMIYKYVDLGTRPHIIRPKNGKMLRFHTGGSPHTRPGSLRSGPGSRGGGIAWAKIVHHPGTRARGFTEQIKERQLKTYNSKIYNAIRLGLRRVQGGT